MKRTCTAAALLILIPVSSFAADYGNGKSSAADASARVAAATASCEKLKGTEKTACLRQARQADKGGAQPGNANAKPGAPAPAK